MTFSHIRVSIVYNDTFFSALGDMTDSTLKIAAEQMPCCNLVVLKFKHEQNRTEHKKKTSIIHLKHTRADS